MQRLQLLKASLEGAATLVREFCLRKREVAVKPTFTRMLAQFFNEDIAEWSRAVMARGMHLQRYALSFPTPVEAGQVPLPGFPRTREWLTKAEVKKTGENWLAGRLTGALNIGRERRVRSGRQGPGRRMAEGIFAPSTQGSNGRTEAAHLWT